MLKTKNIFLNKKILIYGAGKTGLSCYQYLKKNNEIYIFDDFGLNKKNRKIKNNFIKYKNINNTIFDHIIISPGINIEKCMLSKYLIIFF